MGKSPSPLRFLKGFFFQVNAFPVNKPIFAECLEHSNHSEYAYI